MLMGNGQSRRDRLIEEGRLHLFKGREQRDKEANYAAAEESFRRALALYQEAGSEEHESYARGGLGQVFWRQGRFEDALEEFDLILK